MLLWCSFFSFQCLFLKVGQIDKKWKYFFCYFWCYFIPFEIWIYKGGSLMLNTSENHIWWEFLDRIWKSPHFWELFRHRRGKMHPTPEYNFYFRGCLHILNINDTIVHPVRCLYISGCCTPMWTTNGRNKNVLFLMVKQMQC